MQPPSNTYDEFASQYTKMMTAQEKAGVEPGSNMSRFLQVVGDVFGLTVLDAGCGEGYLSRIRFRFPFAVIWRRQFHLTAYQLLYQEATRVNETMKPALLTGTGWLKYTQFIRHFEPILECSLFPGVTKGACNAQSDSLYSSITSPGGSNVSLAVVETA